jgi:DNA-binding helix-hairpin-helix protein with protein kinase domain
MAPPPHTPTFKDIPEELGALYRRAFERGSESGTRPRPAEWMAALSRLEQSLAGCAADSGHKFWKGLQSCVWCRLADHGGPEYFFGIDGGVGNFTVDDARLQEVVQRLKACTLADYPYERRRFTSSQHITPEPLPEGLDAHRNITAALGIAAGLNVLALPFALLHTAIGLVGGLGALVFGVWLVLHLMQSPFRHEYLRRRSARNDAFRKVSELEGRWTQAVTEYQQHYHRSQQAALAVVSQCRGLNRQYQAELQELAIRAEAMARVRHLRLYLIADADIPKFGAGRKQLLAQHGVLTAADIEHHLILRIKGFGDALANALLAWKDDALKGFRFDPSTAVAAADKRAIAAKCRNAQLHCLAELNRLLIGLDSLAPACRGKLDGLTPELQRAVVRLEQAELDLNGFVVR